MVGFFAIGTVLTVLLAVGGWYVLRRKERSLGAHPKRRHREEARLLQIRLDAELDYTQNFHHPTQNELLETLQTLDHLTPGWDRESDLLTDGRFKNELAECFPALRRTNCVYPRPVDRDSARRFHRVELFPVEMEEKLRTRQEERAARAQSGESSQTTVDLGIEHEVAGLHDQSRRISEIPRSRFAWSSRCAVAAMVISAGLVATACLYAGTCSAWLTQWLVASDKPVSSGNDKTLVVSHASVSFAPDPLPVGGSAEVGTPASAQAEIVSGGLPLSSEVVATPSVMPDAPLAAPAMPPLPTPEPQVMLARQIAESKSRALEKHPALGLADSEINLRFVFRYKKMLTDHSPRLQEPNWPETLADECALAAGENSKQKKLTQVAPKRG